MNTNTGKRQIIKATAVIRRPRDGARILDHQERRVRWRPADAVEPPLYPKGLSELLASRPAETGPMASGPVSGLGFLPAPHLAGRSR